MNLEDALIMVDSYIKHLTHDSVLYDREDIIQEGRIATWLGLEKLDPKMDIGQKASFLRRRIGWRINNFIMSNLVHLKISRTTLRKQKADGVDIITKYRALRCASFDGFKSKKLGPYKQACFNEGLSNVKKKSEISRYI